jgi:hypothetical protein
MTAIACQCDGGRDDGWLCTVTLRQSDHELTTHRVRVRASDLDRLAPGADDPTALVTSSFTFLLEREPPESILRSFDLTDVARYFPGYDDEIRRRGRA